MTDAKPNMYLQPCVVVEKHHPTKLASRNPAEIISSFILTCTHNTSVSIREGSVWGGAFFYHSASPLGRGHLCSGRARCQPAAAP